MSVYELTCVFDPKSDAKNLIKKIEGWMEKMGAKVEKKEEWGTKELAYPIKKNSQGFFVFWQFQAEPYSIGDLLKKIKLEDNVVRHLLVRVEED